MTVQAFDNPLPFFMGSDGLPLSAGYVYLGVVDQDPRQYPVGVFYDAGLTIAAAQPLRTTAGYLYRNGSPTNVWVADSCSVLVLDSAARQVYYVANWTGPSVAAAAAAAVAAAPYVSSAQAASASAVVAKTAAEAARDAALTNGKIYVDTATGIANTSGAGATNRYFCVPSGVANEYLILYINNAGVAAEIKRYPSAAAIAELRATSVSGVEYAVQDGNDNASEYVEPATGKRYLNAIDAESVNGIPRYRIAKATRATPNLTASRVHHISYGQSLSLGPGENIHTLPTVDSGFFDCLMFNANGSTTAGPRAQDGGGTVAQNHASLIAYEERPLSGGNPAGWFESPLGNALRMVKRLLRDEDGIASTDYEYALIGSCPGNSNTAIVGLVKGQPPYQRVIDDVTYGLALSTAAGKSYAVDVVYWAQGERDIQLNTARLTYKNAFLQLYIDLNTDIKALTGQSHDIKLVGYQCSTFEQFTGGYAGANIALAQLDAAKANSNIILSTAVYAVEHYAAANVHTSGVGTAVLGAYNGLAAKRVAVDGGTWPALYPTRLTRQGNILDAEFPDTGFPLAISNALFATQTNAGFTATRVDGTTANVITSVTVIGPRRIRVVLTDSLAGFLRYGFASWGGNLHNLRDTDPGTARQAVLYQPCLTFDEAFA